MSKSPAYEIIKEWYNGRYTKRSALPLINHIDEGEVILDYVKAPEVVKDAYFLHPLLQADKDFLVHKSNPFTGVKGESIVLAMEYRWVANSFLSHNEVGDFVGFTCDDVKVMLIVDKIQNYKDFMLYHHGKHERSDELYEYFHIWFALLQIDYKKILQDCFDFSE